MAAACAGLLSRCVWWVCVCQGDALAFINKPVVIDAVPAQTLKETLIVRNAASASVNHSRACNPKALPQLQLLLALLFCFLAC